MSEVQFSFRGLMAPVFTPFDENQNIKYEVIPEYAEYLHRNSIKGILVNGTTGEGVSLTTKERKRVLEAWVKASRPYNLTIMAQVGGTNMEDVKDLARHAEELKVSSILCLADLFFRPSTVDDLVRYLKTVSASAPNTPLLYYHIPSFTGINLNMKELMVKGCGVPTFSGIKFTDGDLATGTACISVKSSHHAVFLGCDTLWLPALVQGFDSAIATTVNVFPEANTRILRYFQEGRLENAARQQEILNHNIREIAEQGSWVSSMKSAMTLLTPVDVGPVRDPLLKTSLETGNLKHLESVPGKDVGF